MLKKIKRRVLRRFKATPPIIDYVDAPILRAHDGRIPVGDTVAIAPNYRPVHTNSSIELERLGQADVTGSQGWIMQRGIWLMQFSWYGGQTFLSPSHQVPPFKPPAPEHTQSLSGEVVTTIPCYDNVYGHVLIDELPMLIYLLQEDRFEAYDVILCSGLAVKLIQRIKHPSLSKLLARTKPADRTTLYRASSLTAFRRSGCRMNPSRLELDLLRNAVEPFKLPDDMPKRIFLTRNSTTRSIENMEDVSKILDTYDITPVSAGSHPDPWALFAQAEIVTGIAGSDLSDSAFMTPKAVLFEIHPSDHVKPFNWNVAQTLDLTYHSMIAQSRILRGTPIGPGNSPVRVNPAIFVKALEEAVTATK